MLRGRHKFLPSDDVLLLLTTLLAAIIRRGSSDDGVVMGALAKATNPPGWTGPDFCKWDGVACDTPNKVSSINLASKSLSGKLPPEINQLSNLKTPSAFNGTSFQGRCQLCPTWLLFKKSILKIMANKVGKIPDIFGSLPNFANLKLSYNNLTGWMPWSFAKSGIQTLMLNNQMLGLSGPIDILGEMHSLREVWIHSNQFSGSIPDLSACTELSDLQLRDNRLTGVIPDSLTKLPKLKNAALQSNVFQGPVPSFPPGIQVNLGKENHFCNPGPGPCSPQVTVLLEIAASMYYPMVLAEAREGNDACQQWQFVTLPSLRSLYLNDNKLVGVIPKSLTSLKQLQILDISNNNISGKVPSFQSTMILKTDALRKATNNFSQNSILGKGGFGIVYKGELPNGTKIAVKRMESSMISDKGLSEFKAEIEVLTSHGKPELFIHRDLKPSNILIGDDMRAKVCDFGLVKQAPDTNQSFETRLAGTFGYLAPEYAATGKVTVKVDVYAFGVVLMEIITGRKSLDSSLPDDSSHLVTWFPRFLQGRDKIKEAVDPVLRSDLNEETFKSLWKVAELAGHCTREANQRPDMSHVVTVLSSLVEQWKPAADEDSFRVDIGMSLSQVLQKWKLNEDSFSTIATDYIKQKQPPQ
ncbi:hypothetical protein SASPL_135728 [Salvia splendens]|uniref:Protein kinase domain-containing protein n=1 Tax=Salvia splendens TaxID=180675 RepID=A0A8X8X0A7_SALSN|nr:hypothetical protein SASPL_135728 [Salvia splendens]